MNLKCRINGVEYNIAQGATFAEEYNETLDSGTIIIPQVRKIKNLMPFDDVFIYDSESEFIGYGEGVKMPKFYKHLLVDQYSEELVNLDKGIYTNKIELMSETKKLEVIQLPNISVTQPLKKEKKKSIYDYLVYFVELYSPLKKVVDNKTENTWTFEKKYTVSESLKEIFSNVISPDFSLNNPSLKDVLTQLMLVKDRIPYVKDDVIYALDISARKGKFDLNRKYVNYISGSRSSANHADNLKRTYSNALSQDNTCNMVEYMGFRNSDSALLTIDNMRLETRYPIYKINKVYMCYYKRASLKNNETLEVTDKYFLCKQDISKLVKLNSERNLLSQDWSEFDKAKISEKTIDELAKYKMMTIGYDIGSNFIEGWGTKYSYPVNWFYDGNSTAGLLLWDQNATYVQNIFTVMDNFYPLGIYEKGFIDEYANISYDEEFIVSINENFVEKLDGSQNEGIPLVVNPFNGEIDGWTKKNASIFLKSLFFIVDYNAFYNGTVIHSKDNVYRDDITINDNSSSSLTLLEKDGIFQKEKINRFGNKGIAINARYTDVSQLQELGSVYENEDDNDVVIYHREYSIWDNVINCSYAGTKNYVLKNYFTSVFARHRTYNLMSYSESTTRAENNKMMILLSKNKSYYEKENYKFEFDNFKNNNYLKQIFSFIVPTEKTKAVNFFENRGEINAGIIGHTQNNMTNYYLSDVNKFVCGNSLCFNIKMFDNVSGGIYIRKLQPEYNFSVEDDVIGSVQDWYMTVDDIETGQAKSLYFYICNLDKTALYYDKVIDDKKDIIYDSFPRIFSLPKIDRSQFINLSKNIIGGEYIINKDNKETIDMTFQIEPITYGNNVIVSPWTMKLSDLLTTYNKFEDGLTNVDFDGQIARLQSIYTNIQTVKYKGGSSFRVEFRGNVPMMVISFDKKLFDSFKRVKDIKYKKKIIFEKEVGSPELYSTELITKYSFEIKEIRNINQEYIEVYGEEKIEIDVYDSYALTTQKSYKMHKTLKFKKIENSKYLEVSSDKIYFSNLTLTGMTDENDSIVTSYWEFEWSDENNKVYYYDENGNKITFEDNMYYISCGKEYSTHNIKDGGDPILNLTNSYFEDSVVPKKLNGTLIYTKNMYIVLSNEKTKKDVIYEEYTLEEMREVKDYTVGVFEQSGDLDIQIDKKTVVHNLDEGTHILRISWNEAADVGEEIVLSLDDVIINKNQLIEYGINIANLNDDFIFGDKNTFYEVIINIEKISDDLKVSNVFSIEKDELSREYLKVDLTYVDGSTRSVQYWYLNNGSLNFVFAVNITEADFELGYVKIYLSLLSTRDTRVYDDKNNIVGEICNYADPNNTKTYGKDQYYCDIINNE